MVRFSDLFISKSVKKKFIIKFWLATIATCAIVNFPIIAQTIWGEKNISELTRVLTNNEERIVFNWMNSTNALNDTSKIKTLFELAKSAYYHNKYETSITLHQRFLSLINSKDSQNYYFSELLTSYSQLADLFHRKNEHINSIFYNKLALKLLFKENQQLENYWFYFYRIGRSYYSLSDYTNSLIYYLESEKFTKQPFINGYSEVAAVIKNNIGLCYLKLGRKEASARNFYETIRIYDNLHESKDLGKILNNIALVYQENNDFEKSLTYFHKSLNYYRSVEAIDNIPIVLNNIGNVYFSMNDFNNSIDFYSQALNSSANKNSNHVKRNLTYHNNLSLSYLKLGMIDSANFHNSLCMMYLRSINADSLKFLISDYFYTNTDRIEINLAYYYLSGDPEYLIDSFETFNTSVSCLLTNIDKDYNLLYTNPFLHLHKQFFDQSIISAKFLDKELPKTVPRTSIISEIYKTLSVMNFGNELNLLSDNLKIEKQCQQTMSSLNLLTNFLASGNEYILSNSLNIDSLIIEDLSNQNSRFENEKLLKNQIIQYIENVNSAIEFKTKKIHNTTYLDYYFTSDEVYIHLYCKDQILLYCTKTKINLSSTIANYAKAIKLINYECVDSIGKVLGELLITPLIPSIKTKTLIIIPESLTSRIPFDALKYRTKSGELDFLINRFELNCSLSFLNRNFSGEKHHKNYESDFCGFSSIYTNNKLVKIPNSEEEIDVIATCFKNSHFTSRTFKGDSLTLKNVFKYGINSRILHISAHSIINDTIISFNRLALSDDLESLFLPVLHKIPFKNELISLSSCETLLDLSQTAEGTISFLKSFSHSKTVYILGSLWKIYDLPTKLFNEVFYKYICEGSPPNVALTLTKRHFLSSQNYHNPVFWAPFQLYENKN